MIPKDGIKIKRYAMIDRNCEGLEPIVPVEAKREIISGIITCHGNYDVLYIEHRQNGKLTETVNIADVSWIEFE